MDAWCHGLHFGVTMHLSGRSKSEVEGWILHACDNENQWNSLL